MTVLEEKEEEMRDHLKATIALLVLLPLPVLYACGEGMTEPDPKTQPADYDREEGPTLVVYPDLVVLEPGQSIRLEISGVEGEGGP
jgi:hypothetical protein